MKKKLSLLIALVMAISLLVTPVVAQAASVNLGGAIYTNVLTLENKNTTTWQVIGGDGIGGTLGYNASGSNFVWSLSATGLDDGSYALIYYADYSLRFSQWGGNNPGAVISSPIAAVSGVISASGSIDLGMDLPCPPDANQFEIDYSGAPDNYSNAHGAKIWLVPTSVLTSGTSLPIVSWTPNDNWLFETDLIWYDDTDVISNTVAITLAPTAINFGILAPGQTGGPVNVTVTNSGNVPIDVTAPGMAPGNVFFNLLLNGGFPSAYTAYLQFPGNTDSVALSLPVPSNYVPAGPETGQLVFMATVHP